MLFRCVTSEPKPQVRLVVIAFGKLSCPSEHPEILRAQSEVSRYEHASTYNR